MSQSTVLKTLPNVHSLHLHAGLNHIRLNSTVALKLKYSQKIGYSIDCLLTYFCLGLEIFNYRPSYTANQKCLQSTPTK